MPDSTTLPSLAPLLAVAFGAGAVTQFARQLAGPVLPRLRQVLALAVAAGIAALTVAALLTVFLRPPPAPALLLAVACVTGWSGPGILSRLGALVERKLGLPEGAGRERFGNGTHGTDGPSRSDQTEV